MAENIAAMIDHTALKPQTTEADVRRLCAEAAEYGFASVCVNTGYLPLCRRLLKEERDTGVKCCVVIGFPLGACATEVKVFEAMYAVREGADELDMVINVAAVKEGRDEDAAYDVRAVREACRGRVLKVIIETSLLTDEEKARATRIAAMAGADFVKTSTGFAGGGATPSDVALMRSALDELERLQVVPHVRVKASGGIRSYADALAVVNAGADRIGTSSGAVIASEAASFCCNN